MKYNLKISLSLYKILYSSAYMFLLVLLRPTATIYEILVAIEPNVCFLALIFISDIYYCEFKSNRIDTFYLLPNKHKFKSIMQRYLIDLVYLLVLVISFFWIYVLFQDNNKSSVRELFGVYASTIVCCFMTILFFSALACTLVNGFQNLWIGLIISIMIWFLFNMKIKEQIPIYINIFAYEKNAGITPYYFSRGLYALIGLVLLLFNYIFVSLPPLRKVKKGEKNDRC